MEASDRVLRRVARAHPGMRSGDAGGTAGQQGHDGAQAGMPEVLSCSRHWPCLFPQHGPGRKHSRTIELADWQRIIVERYPGDFVRGLFHSDGYRGINRVRRNWGDGDHWYEYPRYLFVNNSADILRLCGQTLDQLDVEWRFSKPDTISVARKVAV